jgi:hypothetical protein
MTTGPDDTFVAIALMLLPALALGFGIRELMALHRPRLVPIPVKSVSRNPSGRRD